jgi:hypothetical protein
MFYMHYIYYNIFWNILQYFSFKIKRGICVPFYIARIRANSAIKPWISYQSKTVTDYAELNGFLLCLQDLTIYSYPKPLESTAHPTILFYWGIYKCPESG